MSQPNEPLVMIVILNWNGCQDTLDCLESLEGLVYKSFQIIVVDNGSTDGSPGEIRKAFPQASLIQNESNMGFSAGNNAGIRVALQADPQYIMLLNNDTVVHPKILSELVSVMEAGRDTGIAGPKIYYFEEQDRIWSAGGRLTYRETVTNQRGFGRIDRGQYDKSEIVDYVPACAMLISKEVFEQIGLLDTTFSPAYFEDTDFCMRANAAGFKTLYVPDAIVWHKVSRSSGGEYNHFERYMLGYNSTIFMRRYANSTQWARYWVFAVFSLPFLFVIRVFQGKGRAVIHKGLGIFDGLTGRTRRIAA